MSLTSYSGCRRSGAEQAPSQHATDECVVERKSEDTGTAVCPVFTVNPGAGRHRRHRAHRGRTPGRPGGPTEYALAMRRPGTLGQAGQRRPRTPNSAREAVLGVREDARVADAIKELEAVGVRYELLTPHLEEFLAGLDDEIADVEAKRKRATPAAHRKTLRTYPGQVVRFAKWLEERLAGYGVPGTSDLQLKVRPEWLWGSSDPAVPATASELGEPSEVTNKRVRIKVARISNGKLVVESEERLEVRHERIFLSLAAVPAILRDLADMLELGSENTGPSYTDHALFELLVFVRTHSADGPHFREVSIILEAVGNRYLGDTVGPHSSLGDPDALKVREMRLRKHFLEAVGRRNERRP